MSRVVLCLLLAASALAAQSGDALSPGDVLVASEKLGDPNFAKSVILLVQYDDEEGTVGLILNRQTDIPLSKLFPKVRRANQDPAYMGGPVEMTAVLALLRSSQKLDGATAVVSDIYVTGTKELIEKSITSHIEPSKFRIYLGYAGWAGGQLEAEIRSGAWSVLHGKHNVTFDANPDSLWFRLARESQMQIASSNVFSLKPPYARSKILIEDKISLRLPSGNLSSSNLPRPYSDTPFRVEIPCSEWKIASTLSSSGALRVFSLLGRLGPR